MGSRTEGIGNTEKNRRNYKPCKGLSKMVSDERGNVYAIGKQHDTFSTKNISHKSTWDFKSGPENKAYGIQDSDLGIAKTLVLKEDQYQEEFEEPLILQKTIETEFIVLPIFGERHIRIL